MKVREFQKIVYSLSHSVHFAETRPLRVTASRQVEAEWLPLANTLIQPVDHYPAWSSSEHESV